MRIGKPVAVHPILIFGLKWLLLARTGGSVRILVEILSSKTLISSEGIIPALISIVWKVRHRVHPVKPVRRASWVILTIQARVRILLIELACSLSPGHPVLPSESLILVGVLVLILVSKSLRVVWIRVAAVVSSLLEGGLAVHAGLGS